MNPCHGPSQLAALREVRPLATRETLISAHLITKERPEQLLNYIRPFLQE